MTIQNRTPTLSEIILEAIEGKLLNVHTALPGRVDKYYVENQSADIKPLMHIKFALGRDSAQVDIPTITRASVVWPAVNNSNTYIHLPLKPGDLGILIFCERALDQYLASVPEVDYPFFVDPAVYSYPRHHDVNDAWFIPGGLPFAKALQDVSEDDIVIRHNDFKINIKPDGKITIDNGSYELIETLSTLLDNLINATVQTDDGPRPFTPTTITALTNDKSKIDSFKNI